jgi:hypothetical protein
MRAWTRGVLLATVGAVVALLAMAGSAVAATTCPTTPGPESVTFSSTGAEQTCVIPTGVSSVSVMAVGGAGGANYNGTPSGGLGAVASGTLTVTGGETLYVEVGGAGSDGINGGDGGFNGGGSSFFGGGGGGASDVRTDPASTPLTTTDSRLIVAAGGGGAGADGNSFVGGFTGGGGGAGGTAGGNGSPDTDDGIGGGMGGGAGQSSAVNNGGAGGTAGPGGRSGGSGGSGTLGSGGNGGNHLGGSGGGGVYGGGGGGAYGSDANGDSSGSGGGGGGSSLVPAGGSVTANSSGLASQVTISYTVPAPAACTGDSATTPYQTAKTITFSCTGTGLTYSLVSGPSHGTLGAINGNQVTYTPNAGYSGPDSFVVQAQATVGGPATDTVSVTVSPPPAPSCSGDSAATAYNTAKTVTFSCTGTGLTYSLVSGPSHGTLGAINGDQVTYTPNAGFSGPDSFQVQATDVAGQTATDTVTVTVAAAIGPPTATITTPANGATYTQGQVVDASYTCADASNGPGLKSGTAGCSGTVADGAAINTATLGAQTFKVTATSTDGQTTTETSDYTVVAVAKLADVKVSITGPSHAADGATFSETVKVSNAGPAPATSVITGLVIPNGLTATNTGGGGKLGSAIYWTAGSIAAGQSVTYTVTLKVAANARGSALIPVASASTQVKDPDYANNAATTTVTLGSTSGSTSQFHSELRARAQRNPLATGNRIITRLEHRTLSSRHAPRHHR